MGGSESKTAINSLSSAIAEIVAKTVQSCEVSSEQNQSLVINNTGLKLWGSYKMDQQTDISSSCFSDVNKQVEIQNKIIEAITQASSSSNVALLGAFGSSSSEASANLNKIIKNNITMENIQKTYTSIKQNQSLTMNNPGVVVFEEVALTQGSKLFAAATLKELDKAGVFNQISSHIDQKSSAKMDNPLDFIANALGAISASIMLVILLVIIIIVGIVFGGPYLLKLLFSDDH